MANKKISELTNLTGATSNDIMPIVHSGTTYKISYSALTGQFPINDVNEQSGSVQYVPILSGSNTLTTSLIHQVSGYSVHIGPINHTNHTEANPDRFGVYAGETDSYNLISAHGTIDNYLQVNVQNFSSGSDASSDFVATADDGDETTGYINMGINGSNYTNTEAVGNAKDAYIYSTGEDLLIGNASTNKRVVIFNGGLNAGENAKLYVHENGTVSVNTDTNNTENPASLRIKAPNSETFNLIYAYGEVDNYSQLNIQNLNGGEGASSDIVATANNGTETTNYVNMGINGDGYVNNGNGVGHANDAYFYGLSENTLVGNASANKKLILFSGGLEADTNAKLILDSNDNHKMTGSLEISGSLKVNKGITGSLDFSNLINIPAYLATTGSNSFVGRQVVTGSMYISGSLTYDLEVNGQILLQNTDSGATRKPRIILSGSNLTNEITNNFVFVTDHTIDVSTYLSPSYNNIVSVADGSEIGYVISGSTAGISGWTGPSIYVNNPSNNYPAVIGFQNKNNWTDGRVSLLRGADVTGSLRVTGSIYSDSGYVVLSHVSSSLNFNNDSEAQSGGVPLGGLYRSGSYIMIRLT